MSEIKPVSTKNAPTPGGSYNQAVVANNLIFVSGQLGFRPSDGQLVAGGIEAETRQVFENIKAVLEAAGSGLKDLLKLTLILADLNDFSAMNGVYSEMLSGECDVLPARTTFEGGKMPRGARLEVDAIAIKRD